MNNKFIPLSTPNIGDKELSYINEAVANGWVSAGEYIGEFEKEVAKYVDAPEAVACQSGTAAIHLALQDKNIGEGQEVIVPTLTFIATVNPVVYTGAEPVFMDCDDTLCMDMNKLEQFCEEECIFIDGKLINKSSQKHVSAVIVVHVFGNLANMDRLMQIADKYNLYIIEDAAEALGSYYKSGDYQGKYAGTIGDVGIYSFNGNKIITSGGGGMVVSNNKKTLDHIRYLSTQAKDNEVYFLHNEIGFNYRMTNIQAAVGYGQFQQLEKFIANKKSSYDYYQEQGIKLYPFRKDTRPNFWFFSYLCEDRDGLITFLSENNIQSRPIWHLIHTLPPYKGCCSYEIEKATYYWEKIVNIPCSTHLTKEEQNRVIEVIKEFEG